MESDDEYWERKHDERHVYFTSERLERLYDRYNKLYWYGALPRCFVAAAYLPHGLGVCDPYRKRIVISVNKHYTRNDVRSTLLHEMAHMAIGRGGHGEKFFFQFERLLQKGAPVTLVDVTERAKKLPQSRFPLCRTAIEMAKVIEFRTAIRSGAYGDQVCERPGCYNIIPTPEDRLFPRQRFCSHSCRNWARQEARRRRRGMKVSVRKCCKRTEVPG